MSDEQLGQMTEHCELLLRIAAASVMVNIDPHDPANAHSTMTLLENGYIKQEHNACVATEKGRDWIKARNKELAAL